MVGQKAVKDALKNHQIELPSWAFGNSGTRFKVFGQPGVPRNPYEKADDAAQVHKYTGVAPVMAVHIPWDKVDDYAALSAHAHDNGIRIGAVNANVFQDDDYKLGSVCNPDPKSRKKALAHLLECVDIMDATGSRDLKLWFADGTNYPGQDDIAARQDRLAEALAAVYARLGDGQRMLLEYKLFEPSFYTTDVPDWGTALLHCQALGDRAQVVVDTGHHAPGVNIEFIVALLLKSGKLGGFDFNSRFYADDDLMVGAADPFQLFRIMHEVVKAAALYPGQPKEITATSGSAANSVDTKEPYRAPNDPPSSPSVPASVPASGITASGATARAAGEQGSARASGPGIAFMLDQCHNIEPKIPAQIRSVMNVQEAVAKALLVDAAALREAQRAGDVLEANAVLMDAYNTDVRPLLAELREEMGLAPEPVKAYLATGYAAKIVSERVGGTAAGWGA
ncbi:MAG TPA: TIM barrel protein [Trebonia sp.]|jgi:L-rhamnose isomerase/sugar isomerase